MKCPNCGAQSPEAAAECPACGVIIAKFKKKLETLEPSATPPVNPWIGRSIALVFLIAWLIGFAIYYHGAVSVMRVTNPRGPARSR